MLPIDTSLPSDLWNLDEPLAHYWIDPDIAQDPYLMKLTTRFARWHDGQGNQYNTSIQTPVNAADDLITTVEDYCRLGLNVMNGAGLSDSLYADMVFPQVSIKADYYRCLGWGLVKNLPDGEYALEHGGSDIGVQTMAVQGSTNKTTEK